MLKNKFLLGGIILVLATSSALAPVWTLSLLGITSALFVFYKFPTSGLITAILATTLGEFGRLTLGGVSFLALDLIVPLVFCTWLIRKFVRREKILLDRAGGALLFFWLIAGFSLLLGSTSLDAGELKTAASHLFRFIGLSGLFFVTRDITQDKEPRIKDNDRENSRLLNVTELRTNFGSLRQSKIKNPKSKILNTILLAGFALALSGFYLLRIMPDFTEAGLTELGFDPHIDRLTGTWLDPNFAAGAFAFLLPLIIAGFFRTKKIWGWLILAMTGGVLLSALLFTYSRSGLVALGAAMLVFGVIRSRTTLVILCFALLVGIGVSSRLQERVGELVQSASSFDGESQQVLDPTAELRLASWQDGWRIFSEHPILGVGFNAYSAHQNFSGAESHAATGSDSSLLNVAAMTGGVGLLIFLTFLGSVFFETWQNRADPLALGALAGISGLLVHSVFVNSLFFPPLTLFLFVLAGFNPPVIDRTLKTRTN